MMLSRILSRIEELFREDSEQRTAEFQRHSNRLKQEVKAEIARMETRLGEEFDELLERLDSEVVTAADSTGMDSSAVDKLIEWSRAGVEGVDQLIESVEEMKEWSRREALGMTMTAAAPLAGMGVGVPRFYESHHLAEAHELFAGVKDEWLRGTLGRMHARMRFAELTNDVGLLCVIVIQQLEAYAHLVLRELYVQDGKWAQPIEFSWGWDKKRNRSRSVRYNPGDRADLVPLTDFVINLNGWSCVQLITNPEDGVQFRERQSTHDHIFHHRCEVRIRGEEKVIFITSPVRVLAAGLNKGQWLRVERLMETAPSVPINWVLHFGMLRNRIELDRPAGRGPFIGLLRAGHQNFDIYTWKEDDADKWVRGMLSGQFRWYPGKNDTISSDSELGFERGRRRRVDAQFDRIKSRSEDGKAPDYINILGEFITKSLLLMKVSSSADWTQKGSRAQMLARIYHERNRFTHSNLSFQRASAPACSVGEVVDFWDNDIRPCIPQWIPHVNAWAEKQFESSRFPTSP